MEVGTKEFDSAYQRAVQNEIFFSRCDEGGRDLMYHRGILSRFKKSMDTGVPIVLRPRREDETAVCADGKEFGIKLTEMENGVGMRTNQQKKQTFTKPPEVVTQTMISSSSVQLEYESRGDEWYVKVIDLSNLFELDREFDMSHFQWCSDMYAQTRVKSVQVSFSACSASTNPCEMVLGVDNRKDSKITQMFSLQSKVLTPNGVGELELVVNFPGGWRRGTASTDFSDSHTDSKYLYVAIRGLFGHLKAPSLARLRLIINAEFLHQRFRGQYLSLEFGSWSKRIGEMMYMTARNYGKKCGVFNYLFGGNSHGIQKFDVKFRGVDECEHKKCNCHVQFVGKEEFLGEHFDVFPRRGGEPFFEMAVRMNADYELIQCAGPGVVRRKLICQPMFGELLRQAKERGISGKMILDCVSYDKEKKQVENDRFVVVGQGDLQGLMMVCSFSTIGDVLDEILRLSQEVSAKSL